MRRKHPLEEHVPNSPLGPFDPRYRLAHQDGPLEYAVMEQFSARGCQDPDCGCGNNGGLPLSMQPACHPGHGLIAMYWKGTLRLLCSVCGRHVNDVRVQGAPSVPDKTQWPR